MGQPRIHQCGDPGRAVTVAAPWGYAVAHLGMDVLNRTRPVAVAPCHWCKGVGAVGGTDAAPTECQIDDVMRGAPEPDPFDCWPWCTVDGFHARCVGPCSHCDGSGIEPIRVMIHQGKTWDTDTPMRRPWHWSPWMAGDCKEAQLGAPFAPSAWAARSTWNDISIAGRPLALGAVVAVATITGSHETDWSCDPTESPWPGCLEPDPNEDGDWWGGPTPDDTFHPVCSRWAQFSQGPTGYNGRPIGYNDGAPLRVWHWQLADVQALAEPVPARGRPGLWTPSADTIEQVERQLT